MIGIIGCEALYHEVERLRPEATVRYVPQELHEFPVNVPDDDAIREAVQTAIDELDDPDRDRIVIAYADCIEIDGLQSHHVPLVCTPIDDCVSAVLDRPVSETTGERKAAGTYYLTRGTIDCGVDGYKLYAAYRNELDDLLARFEWAREVHPDLRPTWADGDRFTTVVEGNGRPSQKQIGAVFHEVYGGIDRVELVDTGGLYDLHRDYAEMVRRFIEQLSAEYGDGHEVDLDVVDGDTSRLERAVSDAPLETMENESVEVYWPR